MILLTFSLQVCVWEGWGGARGVGRVWGWEGAGMSQDTHSHVAFSHGEGLSRQHVCLHQILHMDPVHSGPAVPKPEHEQSLLDVALGAGGGER